MVRESDSSHATREKMPISQYALKDLLQSSLLSSPIVSVTTEDLVTEAANLLPHHLEGFTDSLVVVQDEKPVGLVGGIEILEGVLRNPNASFFEKTRIKEIMSKQLITLTDDTTLGYVLDLWKKTGRAFAIMPNAYHGYSAISARKLLEVGMSCITKLRVGDVSKRKLVTFGKEQKVKEIIESMFKNKTRKLILEGTMEFISDRLIIQKISCDLNCLHDVNDFLDMKASVFQLNKAKKVSGQIALEEGCKILYNMQSPCLLLSDYVVTPWDVIMSLRSDNIKYNWKSEKMT